MAVHPSSWTTKQDEVPAAQGSTLLDGLGKHEQNCCALAKEYTVLFGPQMAAISEHGHPIETPLNFKLQ